MAIKDYQGGEKNQDVTEEVDSQYQTDSKASGSAILYGLFALVVTLIVAAGLFFGGRAVYRALTGTGDEEIVEVDGQDGTNGTTDNETGQDPADQTPGVSSDTANGETDTDNEPSGRGSGTSADIPSTGDSLPATGSPTGI